MDWLSASVYAECGLCARLLGKIEPFFLPVDSCLLERQRKTSVVCKGESESERERVKEEGIKEMTTGFANTISPKCSSSFACCALFTVEGKHLDASSSARLSPA